ncbi:Formamidopyrimidine-DNA glycosylase [Hartmannibacter diazotrophicus]|uniref:Formamidopyrimidine-DNA glycosylase n=1 Tax=Hartmannibacter diazotrophicus TaxID=1482074 RepID=A0A2C9DDR2_9HYPH|nr:bifunctional DNA-formamidopyrimidine glycosylase/DNA-(apurinic or apyrimidinic site) lyase [Hartmannibacter diazotrophicus]SON58406.1 Formamidopyrimidine-DNA glycosylase [Hartmannibacter diazotrophicus]
MPELPEVETVRRGLQPVMENVPILRVEQRRADLRFAFPERFAERLAGRRIVDLGRRAKYLVCDLDDDHRLVMHLGMSGSFRFDGLEAGAPGVFHHDKGKSERHDHVVFHMENGVRVIYNDPRRFGFMTLIARAAFDDHPHFKGLGLEPTGNALGADFLDEVLAGKRAPLKAALLDQRVIAGLGNIYVCEALWRAGLSPTRLAGTLSGRGRSARTRREALAPAIREVIADAIAAGGSSLKDYRQADGSLGYFQHSFAVYDREGEACQTPGCSGTIERIVQSGRSTFFCPVCQT